MNIVQWRNDDEPRTTTTRNDDYKLISIFDVVVFSTIWLFYISLILLFCCLLQSLNTSRMSKRGSTIHFFTPTRRDGIPNGFDQNMVLEFCEVGCWNLDFVTNDLNEIWMTKYKIPLNFKIGIVGNRHPAISFNVVFRGIWPNPENFKRNAVVITEHRIDAILNFENFRGVLHSNLLQSASSVHRLKCHKLSF